MKMQRELDERCELERACVLRGVDVEVWVDHFGMAHPGTVCCRECEDCARGFCEGRGDPVVCMRNNLYDHMERVHGWA